MIRFLALALPSVCLTFAVFHFGWDALGLEEPIRLSPREQLGLWFLESLGLTLAFLLLRGGGRSRWTAGIAAGWLGWIFRGPVSVLTASAAGHGRGSWWFLALGWLGLYTLSGLILAIVSRRTDADRAQPVTDTE